MSDPPPDPPPDMPDPDPVLRLVRFRDPHAALGHAVAHLMIRPAFARQPFGDWARVLAGQINRGQYLFVGRAGRIVGFGGWSRSPQAAAERWLSGGGDLAPGDLAGGDCLIINACQADDDAVLAFLQGHLHDIARGTRMIYARRSYPDGRDRIVRVATGRFARTPAVLRTDEGQGFP